MSKEGCLGLRGLGREGGRRQGVMSMESVGLSVYYAVHVSSGRCVCARKGRESLGGERGVKGWGGEFSKSGDSSIGVWEGNGTKRGRWWEILGEIRSR